METFLFRFLVITAIGSAIVLTAPSLVVLGLFLMVIPGIILAVLPTTFLWSAIFSAIWWPTKRVTGVWPAVVIAAAATAGVLTAIPAIVNSHIQAEIDALRANDREAVKPIALAGVVRFERTSWKSAAEDDPEWQALLAAFREEKRRFDWSKRPVACDALCAAALFTPNVEAVIVTPVARPEGAHQRLDAAAEFHVERKAGCAGSLQPQEPASFSDGFENLDVLKDDWRVRMSQGNCIRRTAPERTAGLTVAISDWSVNSENGLSGWSMTAPRAEVLRLDIRDDADRVQVRRTRVRTSLLDRVLWIEGRGFPDFQFGWGWHQPEQGAEPGAFTPVALLATLTALQAKSDPDLLADAARTQLTATLDDRARGADDPGIALSERVLEDIGKNGLRDGDAALVERIVGDPRTRGFFRIWQVVKKMGPDAERLRAPIVRRILATLYPEKTWTGVSSLGNVLRSFPAGTFAAPSNEELELLADKGRRNLATGLIERQSDRGTAGVAILTQILVDGWSEPASEKRDLHGADAARYGLCVLGPVAASALPTIEGLLAAGVIPSSNVDDRNWQIMLARLGRPVESFHSPRNHSWSDEQLQSWLRQRLANFDPARDCD